MCDKMGISAYILKIDENDPFLRLQMRAEKISRFYESIYEFREIHYCFYLREI